SHSVVDIASLVAGRNLPRPLLHHALTRRHRISSTQALDLADVLPCGSVLLCDLCLVQAVDNFLVFNYRRGQPGALRATGALFVHLPHTSCAEVNREEADSLKPGSLVPGSTDVHDHSHS